ncbi:MAG: TRAM domain-containing protein, partial [Phoenicibacter congonensis]|nr:TRAM domain-containing protein [Phoenicibacter congonensis]
MSEKVEILRMAYGKGAVAKLASGKTVFVRGGVPGEACEIEITQDHERFAEAKIISREVKADQIMGADWADLDYSAQLDWKKNCVRDALIRNAKFDAEVVDSVLQDTVASPNEWNYRNKIELNWKNGKLGMMDEGTNHFVQVSEFPLAHKEISKAPKALAGSLKFALRGEDCGIFRVGIRHSERTGDIQVAIWTTPGWFPRHEVAKVIEDATGANSIIRIIADAGKTRKIKQVEVLQGNPTWSEKLNGFDYSISAPSFFQVNSSQAEVLQKLVLDALAPTRNGDDELFASIKKSCVCHENAALHNGDDELIADLYCGAGTFTLPLAKAGFDVIGVELAGSSTKDLARNLNDNRLDADVICDEVERALPKMPRFDACVVDPPKCGLNKGVVKQLIKRAPRKIVYVSCDPMTLSRD